MNDIALTLRHGAAVPHPASGHRLKAALGALFFPRQRTRWQAIQDSIPG